MPLKSDLFAPSETDKATGLASQRISQLCAELKDAGYAKIAQAAQSYPSNIRHFAPERDKRTPEQREALAQRHLEADKAMIRELEQLLTTLGVALPRRRPGMAEVLA